MIAPDGPAVAAGGQGFLFRRPRLPAMKKILLLVVLVVLAGFAAKKARAV